MSEQELLITSFQKSSVFSRWELELDTIEQGFYGYGYGLTSNFLVIETGTGTCLFNIASGSGTISGTITQNMGWQIGNDVLVTDLITSETFVGVVTNYDNSTGSIIIAVPSSILTVSHTHICSVEPLNTPSLNYFNVIGLSGTLSGYGYRDSESPSNVTNFEPTYSYGWGYEFSNFIFANSTDRVLVRARVLENGIPRQNIKVVFTGSTGVLLNPAMATTDMDGYAETYVSINKNISINQLDGWGHETLKNRETPQVFRNLIGTGGRTVSATIYQLPEIDDGELKVVSNLNQRFFEQSVFNLDIGSYAFNRGEDI